MRRRLETAALGDMGDVGHGRGVHRAGRRRQSGLGLARDEHVARVVDGEGESARVVVALDARATAAMSADTRDTEVRGVQHRLTGDVELGDEGRDASRGDALRWKRRAGARRETVQRASRQVQIAAAIAGNGPDASNGGIERRGQALDVALAAHPIDMLLRGLAPERSAGRRIRQCAVVRDEIGIPGRVRDQAGDAVADERRHPRGLRGRRTDGRNERGRGREPVDARDETLAEAGIGDPRRIHARQRGGQDDARHIGVALRVEREVGAFRLQEAADRLGRRNQEGGFGGRGGHRNGRAAGCDQRPPRSACTTGLHLGHAGPSPTRTAAYARDRGACRSARFDSRSRRPSRQARAGRIPAGKINRASTGRHLSELTGFGRSATLFRPRTKDAFARPARTCVDESRKDRGARARPGDRACRSPCSA